MLSYVGITKIPMFDDQSLFLALMLSGLCLGVTLLVVWNTSRKDRSTLIFAAGVMLLVCHVLAFWLYGRTSSVWAAIIAQALLPIGFSFLFWGTACYFGSGKHAARFFLVAAVAVPVTTLLTASGYDGTGFVVEYAASTALLFAMAVFVWRHRRLSPTLLTAAAMLWGMLGLSFALCAIVLVMARQWVIGTAPDNWAEQLNAIIAVVCTTGLGGLSVSLHYVRDADRHRADATTDPLTGLPNRRAFMARFETVAFQPLTAIAMFDLDHFKSTNDLFGHAFGDDVICRFADTLRRRVRAADVAVRLGGEEFVLVMQRVTHEEASRIASEIVEAFGKEAFETAGGPVNCTVSAGLAFDKAGGALLSDMLKRADEALYSAKRAGRNRVALEQLRLVG